MSSESSLVRPVSSVGVYARVADLSAVAAVQATLPVQPRFPQVDGAGAQARPLRSADDRPAQSGQDGFSLAVRSQRGGAGGLLGAFTAFLARIIGQGGDMAPVAASARQSAMAAYGKVQGQVQPVAYDPAVSMPNFTPLASGRVLDLLA